MILKYYIEVEEKVDDSITNMTEEDTFLLVNEIDETITKWMKLSGMKLNKPIKIEFDLEEEVV